MAAENLGFLGQFLGGMAQGKLMKQKRSAQSTELKYKQDKMKADAEESLLRKNYRDSMLGIARAKEGREALTPPNAGFLGGQISAAEKTLAEKNKEYAEKLAKETTVAGRRRVLADGRRDIGTAYTNLTSLYQLPGVSNLYGGAPIESVQNIAKQGVNPYFLDDSLDPNLPDVSSVYDFKPGRESVQTQTTAGYLSGKQNPNYYINQLGPRYLQTIEDLSGGDPSLRPAAVRRVMAEYGNIPGLSPEGMQRYLTTGKVDYYEPLSVDPTNPSGFAGGLFEQLPTDQSQELMAQQGGELSGPFQPSSYRMPEEIQTGGATNQYSSMPGMASSRMAETGAFNEIAIPFTTASAMRKEPLEQRDLAAKVTLNEQTLGAKIQEAQNQGAISGYKLAQAPIDLQDAYWKSYVNEVKASTISSREKAEINKILADTTFARNRDARDATKLNLEINDKMAKWIAERDKSTSMEVGVADKNATAALTAFAFGGSNVTKYANDNPDMFKSILSGLIDPREKTVAKTIPEAAMPYLIRIFDSAVANNNAINKYDDWNNDEKPTVGPIINAWKAAMEEQSKKTEVAAPARSKQGSGKPVAKPAAKSGGAPAGLRTPKPNEGVRPKGNMPS
jgi:hypothetical protein